ncbi:conserved hypothetical protein [Vibrio chagasii]|uniref:hypothetical protein n=1 Tax=Vibrio sp. 10N.261.46.A3 TaxID=3229658 RepID=UPI00336F5A80|nr:conserved hypothetical protein [Vibrio chagasii]CAH7089337.1 conserved hypothetical protein [Vibrio chagasii]CAH7094594.1 conserved hypothetical protein [Vibrio chagasii]CAH7105527.1 conserved hypothetical protein [Vibrio chagasii]CAH7154552.1 conserved hypothetical protein [Vibrio chagasii]
MRNIIVICLVMIITGCATNYNIDSDTEIEKINTRGINLNAELYKNSNTHDYYFRNIEFGYGYGINDIDLNNVYSSQIKFGDRTCTKDIWGNNDGIPCPKSNYFRSNYLDPIRTTIHIPVQLLSSLGFRIFAPQYVIFSSFNDDNFVMAYNSAMLDLKSKGIENNLEDLKVYIEHQESEIRKKLDQIDDKPKLVITDKSKIFSDEPLANNSISIEKSLDYSKLPKVNDLKYSDSLKIMKLDYDVQLEEQKGAFLKTEVRCNFDELKKNWNITTEGCYSQDPKSTVKLNILSKKSKYHLPSVTLSNKSLDVEFLNGDIKINNKTNSYIDINTLTLYFGDEVDTKIVGEIELPPNSIYTVDTIKSFENFLGSYEVNETHKNQKQTKTVEFGFAVKYRSADTGEYTSFYQSKPVKYIKNAKFSTE